MLLSYRYERFFQYVLPNLNLLAFIPVYAQGLPIWTSEIGQSFPDRSVHYNA